MFIVISIAIKFSYEYCVLTENYVIHKSQGDQEVFQNTFFNNITLRFRGLFQLFSHVLNTQHQLCYDGVHHTKKANNCDHMRMYIHVMLDVGIWLMYTIFTPVRPSGHNEDASFSLFTSLNCEIERTGAAGRRENDKKCNKIKGYTSVLVFI